MFKLIMAFTGLLWTTGLYAQYSISGTVRDQQQNDTLGGATVELDNTGRTTITNENGLFSFDNVPAGNYTVVIRFVGYAQKRIPLNLNADVNLQIDMEATAQVTEEVVVYATRANDKTPTTFTQVNKEAIQKQNFGQDVPMILIPFS